MSDLELTHQIFTVVIFEDNRENFRGAPERIYKNRDICVSGMIEEYKDIPQIVVSSDFQIK